MVWYYLPVQWMVTVGNLYFVLFKGPILLVLLLALNHHISLFFLACSNSVTTIKHANKDTTSCLTIYLPLMPHHSLINTDIATVSLIFTIKVIHNFIFHELRLHFGLKMSKTLDNLMLPFIQYHKFATH